MYAYVYTYTCKKLYIYIYICTCNMCVYFLGPCSLLWQVLLKGTGGLASGDGSTRTMTSDGISGLATNLASSSLINQGGNMYNQSLLLFLKTGLGKAQIHGPCVDMGGRRSGIRRSLTIFRFHRQSRWRYLLQRRWQLVQR